MTTPKRKSVHKATVAKEYVEKFTNNIILGELSPTQKIFLDAHKEHIRGPEVRILHTGSKSRDYKELFFEASKKRDLSKEISKENYVVSEPKKIHYYNLLHRVSKRHHGTKSFLGWHRLFLQDFEVDLDMPLPYFDWLEHEILPDELAMPALRKQHVSVSDNSMKKTVENYFLNIDRKTNKFDVARKKEAMRILVYNILYKFSQKKFNWYLDFAKPWEGTTKGRLARELKFTFHGRVHGQLGGVITDNGRKWRGHLAVIKSSPLDPVFWLHHSFVDKLWADLHGIISKSNQKKFYYDYPKGALPKPYESHNHKDIVDIKKLDTAYKYDVELFKEEPSLKSLIEVILNI